MIIKLKYYDILKRSLPRRNKEGKYNMCVMDLEKKNQEIGKEIGKENTWVEAIRNIMKTSTKTFEEACAMLCINQVDMVKYRKMI